MDRRGIAEIGGLSLSGGVLATVSQQVILGGTDWVFVVGLMACIGIAAAANYRARINHTAQVAGEAPVVTEDNYEQHGRPTAGDGGVAPADASPTDGAGGVSPPDDAPATDDDR